MQLCSLAILCLLGTFVSAEWKSEEKPKEHHHEHLEHIKNIIVTKKVPKPVPVEVEKHVPYEVRVPVDKPYPVYVPKPYPVYVEKKVPYEVQVPVPKPYVVEKKIPYEVKVPIDKPYPVEVPQPYNVYVEKKVPYIVEKKVPYKVQVPVEKKYPVPYTVEKQVPYPVVKEVPYKVEVPVEKPVPYQVEKPVPYQVQKEVPYPVYKEVPYPVRVPYKVEVPYPVEGVKSEGGNDFQGKVADSWQHYKTNFDQYGIQHSYSTKHTGGAYSTQFVQLGSLSKNEGSQGSSGHGQTIAYPEETKNGGYLGEFQGHYSSGQQGGWKQETSGFGDGISGSGGDLKSYSQDSGSSYQQYPEGQGTGSSYSSDAEKFGSKETSNFGSSAEESSHGQSATSDTGSW